MKMLRRVRKVKEDQSGFTLVELLIVIVILGILAAIVVFAVSAFNKNGQAAACKADFKSVEIADEAYFAKNQAYATTQADLAPSYIKQWPQTDPANGTPLANAPYTITVGTALTGPSVQVGATITPNTTACDSLS
jgi:prepilin-type N-terminal cleavage/methylation domain-containing protein